MVVNKKAAVSLRFRMSVKRIETKFWTTCRFIVKQLDYSLSISLSPARALNALLYLLTSLKIKRRDTIPADEGSWGFELKMRSLLRCFYFACSWPYQLKLSVSSGRLHKPLFISCISFAKLVKVRCLLFFPVCGQPLGVARRGDDVLEDRMLEASSEDLRHPASSGRLEDSGWAPRNDSFPYLQIDLVNLYLVCGVKVQGCTDFKGKPAWVTRYRVQVSPEKDFWDSWNYLKVWSYSEPRYF